MKELAFLLLIVIFKVLIVVTIVLGFTICAMLYYIKRLISGAFI